MLLPSDARIFTRLRCGSDSPHDGLGCLIVLHLRVGRMKVDLLPTDALFFRAVVDLCLRGDHSIVPILMPSLTHVIFLRLGLFEIDLLLHLADLRRTV